MTSSPLTYDFGAMKFNRSMFDGDRIPADWGSAFKWHATPQGAAFWIGQHRRLDDEGRAAIDAMVAAYDACLQSDSAGSEP